MWQWFTLVAQAIPAKQKLVRRGVNKRKSESRDFKKRLEIDSESWDKGETTEKDVVKLQRQESTSASYPL